MGWNLYENKKFLPPLKFSNGKTQEDVVNEVLESIRDGYKIIFIKGVCGTGKSAIALNIIKEMGRGSIVVPVKSLQSQYMEDYTKGKYLFTKKEERMKISTIMGRGNFKCAYGDCPANNPELPCTIEIKEEKINLLQRYVQENPLIDDDVVKIKSMGRFTVAAASPYWSPLLSYDNSAKFRKVGECRVMSYDAVSKQKYFLHLRKPGCEFYEQYKSYIDADAIIFNSRMYEIENIIGRKPVTDVEIIDECDKFLDDLGNEKKIDLDRLSLKISQIASVTQGEAKDDLIEFNDLVLGAKKEAGGKIDKIYLLKDLQLSSVIKELINNDALHEFDDLERYFEVALAFKYFLDEVYVSYSIEKEYTVATLVTINLEKRLREFLDKNKVFVMMSGTIHTEEILKEVFGLNNFKIIEAEIKPPGTVKTKTTGLERNFRYKELKEGKVTRESYLRALEKCIKDAERPVLVQINGLKDLPTKKEKER